MQLALTDSGLELIHRPQRIVLQRAAGDRLLLTTYVQRGDGWDVMFDSQKPLLSGPNFDLVPDAFEVLEDSPQRIAVLLTGRQPTLDYAWDTLIEITPHNLWFRFRITCHLSKPLILSTPEPTTALWATVGDNVVTVDQGPVSIYGGSSWGNSFPGAYLWSGGKEALVFFNMSPMRWMSGENLKRFVDCRVATLLQNGQAGLGLHALSQSGDTIPAGHMTVEFFLLAHERQDKPTRLEALNTTIQQCAALLPSTVPFPTNHIPPYELTWKCFAENTILDLMQENISWADVPSTWRDEPAFPENTVPVFRLHSDYAIDSSRTRHARFDVKQLWDNATCNAFLAPWIVRQRLHPDQQQREFLAVKQANVPQFYDPDANLFRWGAAGVPLTPGLTNSMANGIEMSWENFMFHLEPIKIHHALPPDQFNPAIPGRFLIACQGLLELAHNVDYVFPQWFDAFAKIASIQLDLPELGKVREPFQAGTYAYLMLEAFDLTNDAIWLDEAQRALELTLTRVDYTEANRRYTKTFTDPVDVPIAETFGNGYAVAAAQRVTNLTGDEVFLRYAQDYLNILLRMTFWYNDETDAISRDLNNLGLFRAHGGHYGTCPWENIEAYLPLTVFLKHTRSHDELLLKLFNLQRINSFYYYPPTWTPQVAEPNPELYYHVCQYLPIENFYTLEFGGTHGSMGRCIYMCSAALWNYLLYEAFAQTSDREVMALNLDMLDGFRYAIDGIDRTFIVYNPTPHKREFKLTMGFCQDGDYDLSLHGESDVFREEMPSRDLAEGLPLQLDSQDHVRIHIRHQNASTLEADIDTIKRAQAHIAYAYSLLQQAAAPDGLTAELQAVKAKYSSAKNAYDEQAYERAAEIAQDVIDALRTTGAKSE